jgi:hypothetical protein
VAPLKLDDRVCEKTSDRTGVIRAVLIGDPARVVVQLDEGPLEVCDRGCWSVQLDDCVVETAPLAGIVTEFIDRWRKERPTPNSGRLNATEDDSIVMGAYEYLTEKSEIPVERIRSIQNAKRRQPVTELRVADALVAAAGRPEVFYDGTLTIRARDGSRGDCCGGSDSFLGV